MLGNDILPLVIESQLWAQLINCLLGRSWVLGDRVGCAEARSSLESRHRQMKNSKGFVVSPLCVTLGTDLNLSQSVS
jgi:hypothetical protein